MCQRDFHTVDREGLYRCILSHSTRYSELPRGSNEIAFQIEDIQGDVRYEHP